ncbi:MAG: HNH endonuclease [Candidatus Roizmanbacteria bacterium]|nr:HNH endonuclease [Candidatus Roizmanbacteria bacterium]
MGKKRSWTEEELRSAVTESTSRRQVLQRLSLVEAGGNYAQIKKYLKEFSIDISHFKGQAWNKGMHGIGKPILTLQEILIKDSTFQSYKLRNRLLEAGLKKKQCELCGWAEKAEDGRIPLELDHINGVSSDNRLSNLRILCPNCHSLQSTHRGKNRKKRAG